MFITEFSFMIFIWCQVVLVVGPTIAAPFKRCVLQLVQRLLKQHLDFSRPIVTSPHPCLEILISMRPLCQQRLTTSPEAHRLGLESRDL